MKAEVINAKAIRFTDTDNEEHIVLVKDVEELIIERHDKRLAYCIGFPNWPCVIEIDKDTYNVFFESIEKYLGSGTEKIKMELVQDISKKIKFKDLGAWEQAVLPEDIKGLSIEQYEGKLEYFVNISNKGYGTEVDFKTFKILHAALKAVAHAKEQDNGQSKSKNKKNVITFDNTMGEGCAINLDDFDYAEIIQIKTSDIYTVEIWNDQGYLIGDYIVTSDVAEKINSALEKVKKKKEEGRDKNENANW